MLFIYSALLTHFVLNYALCLQLCYLIFAITDFLQEFVRMLSQRRRSIALFRLNISDTAL